jgi:hypothetical protein
MAITLKTKQNKHQRMMKVFPHMNKKEQICEIDYTKWELNAYLLGCEKTISPKQRDINILYIEQIQSYLNWLLINKK